eukprot:NODE_2654_length_1069_cov_4.896078_g2212_i0.p2 GENE.NODE_2654_length_1069_cov_4.896078_g2212_i0~~NODE_2654_length_1069_cov_4.896078_g2212_i0.p2  ORF type:complete len:70 (-),score=1.35 NODE_2654_length_1069_cov_4.896078_g2212_i0:700-909(-)
MAPKMGHFWAKNGPIFDAIFCVKNDTLVSFLTQKMAPKMGQFLAHFWAKKWAIFDPFLAQKLGQKMGHF